MVQNTNELYKLINVHEKSCYCDKLFRK